VWARRHASVMKRIVDGLMAAPGAPPPPVESYLFIFLKVRPVVGWGGVGCATVDAGVSAVVGAQFIASMVPTIQYDFTFAVTVGAGGGR
jgi:hypothetical protein